MQTESFFFDPLEFDKSFWIKEVNQRPISTIRLFEGTLFIKNKKKDLKPRFFRLFTDRLNIYKNGREQKEIAIMFLMNIYLDCTNSNKYKFSFFLSSKGKKFLLCARSYESRQKWIEQFQKTCILSNYRECFINIKVIGKGTFAKVLLSQRQIDKKKFAVKTFQKSALSDKNNKWRMGLLNEINLLRLCDHPNIIKLYEIYESTEYIYLVMELLEGGELFDVILETSQFTEQKVAQIMFKIFDALEYLHTKNIMHRDIKPENILLKDKSDNFDLKIADFGLAQYTEANNILIKRCGTPGYVAPEILADEKYDEKVDVFSAGVILYILLTGAAPFFGSSLDDIIEKNRECLIDYTDLHVSDEALDLLKKTLEVNPNKRLSSLEALSHPFISRLYKRLSSSSEELDELPSDNYSAYENMKKFCQQDSRFKNAKLKKNIIVQQTPFLGQREFDPIKASSDSWLTEKTINPQPIFNSPNINQSSDSDCSILDSPSPRKSQRQMQISALQSFKLSPQTSTHLRSDSIKLQQTDIKKANLIRDQLKKLGN